MTKTAEADNKPYINVTPLIDVLLVVLIIFMVSAPLKPYRFTASLPSEPDPENKVEPDIWTLVVTISPDRQLMLNGLTDMGTVDDASKLNSALASLFDERKRNHAYRPEMLSRLDVPADDRIERTVFIKAPRSIPYGAVTRVIDGVKGAGARPIGLQLDYLN